MRVPILKLGVFLIASVQEALTDADLRQLEHDLSARIGQHRAKGVVIDVTALDVIDSYAARTLRGIAQASRTRGARTVVVGIQPEVAYSMVQLGMTLDEVETALDLEEGLARLEALLAEQEAGLPSDAR